MSKIFRYCLILLLGLWFILIIKFSFFKHSLRVLKVYYIKVYPSYTLSDGWASANLTPFKSITDVMKHPNAYEYAIDNNIGNILGFIPAGILLPLLLPWFHKCSNTTLAILGTSFLIETVQLISGLGIFDIDDLMLNTLGGAIGFGIYYFFLLPKIKSNLI